MSGDGGGKLDARHAAVFEHQIASGIAFEHADGRSAPHRLEQRRHDGAAGGVALDVEDAVAAMRRLAAQAEMAFEVLVERDAVRQQVGNAVTRLARQQVRDLVVDDAGAGADGVGRVRLGRIAFGHRRGDAGLRPQAGRSFAEMRARHHGDGQRRKLERGEQAGQAGADHDHAAVSC